MNVCRSAVNRGLVGTVAALAAILVAASPASAVTGHRLSRSFGTTAPGKLGGLGGVAARAANGDVFVADPSVNAIQHYSEAGDFLGSIDVSTRVTGLKALARDPSSGDLYVAGYDPATFVETVARYSAAGAYKSSLDFSSAPGGAASLSVFGIAVDSTGRVYLDSTPSKVVLFSNTGTYVRTIDGSAGGTPFVLATSVAVDSADNVYVTDYGVSVQKFTKTGAFAGTVGSGRPRSVTVDTGNDDVYVADSPDDVECGLTRYNASGIRQERFAESACSTFFYPPLSPDTTSHNVFAANPSTLAVDVYVTYTAPGATTAAPPANPGATTLDVNGTVNPSGQATTYSYEYGPNSSYGSTTDPLPAGQGSATVTAPGQITGLKPLTTYHYRLKATNSQGSNYGQDRVVTTSAAPPVVSSESATAITAFTATLNATVNPSNAATTAHFEYGTTASYGSRTDEAPVGSGTDDLPFVANVRDLQANTTYHYRVVADNGVGTPTRGDDQTFTTALAPPLASPGPVSGVSGDSAQFSGTVDTQGLAGTVSFVVTARNSPFAAVSASQDLGAAAGSRAVSGSISGLPAGGVFDVRVRVQTSTRTVLSAPVSFSTPAVPVTPIVSAPLIGNSLPAAPAPVKAPSNRFSTSSSVKGSKATVKVKVPGRGSVSVSGKQIGRKTASPKKAGTVSVKVALTKSGRTALKKAKSKRLRVKVAVRYRPTGGTTRSATRTLVFRR